MSSPAPPAAPPSPPARRLRWPIAAATLAFAVVGIAALWVVVAGATDGRAAPMALLAGVDMALMVRLAGLPGGPRRALAGGLATLAAVALALVGLAAAALGRPFGLLPWESLALLGPDLAWLAISQQVGPLEAGLLAAGVLAGTLASR
jgi:hypothetical protein